MLESYGYRSYKGEHPLQGGSSGIICRFMPFIQGLDLGDEPLGSQANFASHVYLRVTIPSSAISITDALSWSMIVSYILRRIYWLSIDYQFFNYGVTVIVNQGWYCEEKSDANHWEFKGIRALSTLLSEGVKYFCLVYASFKVAYKSFTRLNQHQERVSYHKRSYWKSSREANGYRRNWEKRVY